MNNKKTILLVFALAALGFAFIGLMDVIKSKEYNVDNVEQTATPNLLEKKLLVRNQVGSLEDLKYIITGQVLNYSDEDYTSYNLSFDLYNSSNKKIMTCSTTGSQLNKNETSDFKVSCENVGTDIAYYSLNKLEGQK